MTLFENMVHFWNDYINKLAAVLFYAENLFSAKMKKNP